MSAVEGLGLVVLFGLIAYAVLGGADFGAGMWDLTGHRAQRELVAKVIAPVWEANHVWLVFVVITLFTGFPHAFGALSRALTGPMSVALLGIVLRGAAFVFRQYGAPDGGRAVRGTAVWGRVFAVSSLITPFAFGTAAGALAEGAPRPDGSAGLWRPYLQPLPLVAGLLAVLCCAYLAAVYLSRDAERADDPQLVGRLRRRALVTGVLSGGLAFAALPLLPAAMAAVLVRVGLPALGVSVVAGVLGLLLLWRRRYGPARVAAAGALTGLLVGWAVGLYPWALPGQVRLSDAAAPPAIATAALVVLLAGLVVVLPCYVLMVRVLRARSV